MSLRYKAAIIKPGFNPLGVPTVASYTYYLYTWGYNLYGGLGQNDVVYRSSPVQVGALTTWYAIASGSAQSAAIKTDGTLWTWGSNNVGQLGQGDAVARSSPVQVGALTTWLKIVQYYLSVVATKTDGTLWTWGYNAQGQLGKNDIVSRSSPVQVGLLTTWSAIASGNAFSAATKTDGTLWTWGYNAQGQLGKTDVVNRSSPVQVGALATWLNISAGYRFTVATKTDGTLWSWGENTYGQLGQNTDYLSSRSSPVQVGALTTWSNIACGQYFTVATKTDGTLWTWGDNSQGQLGQNTDYISGRSSPVQVGALTTWSKIAAGETFASAIKTDGTLWTWGYNNFGQLGLGNTANRSSPVQVGGSSTWAAISGGQRNFIALGY